MLQRTNETNGDSVFERRLRTNPVVPHCTRDGAAHKIGARRR
jgi:hypothetical protein